MRISRVEAAIGHWDTEIPQGNAKGLVVSESDPFDDAQTAARDRVLALMPSDIHVIVSGSPLRAW
jgi:hypothetical protein